MSDASGQVAPIDHTSTEVLAAPHLNASLAVLSGRPLLVVNGIGMAGRIARDIGCLAEAASAAAPVAGSTQPDARLLTSLSNKADRATGHRDSATAARGIGANFKHLATSLVSWRSKCDS